MSNNKQQKEAAKMLIEAMKAGTAPWLRPWSASNFPLCNGVTGHEYRGINLIALLICPFDDPRYCTFSQATEKGWKIKKESKSSIVRYLAKVTPKAENDATDEKKTFFINKWFRVFNFDQIEGAPALKYEAREFNPIEKCEEILKNSDMELKEAIHSDEAFYDKEKDLIVLPDRSRFASEIDFYKIALHEMGHATGAKHRLNREMMNFFGSKGYAFEELVAEIISFFVGRVAGCGSKPSPNSISYLQNWIEALENDHNYIFKACRLANNAMSWILYTIKDDKFRFHLQKK
ncbi:MAG: ssDNA-binding domain-containing protein [Holosporaceae bacterium]|jgi:antirestriction protein ArdC|nr:ssDNA-binding domain-containing protein [Holosporaceae bacterium]